MIKELNKTNFTLEEKYEMLFDTINKTNGLPFVYKTLPENGFKIYDFYICRRNLVKSKSSKEYKKLVLGSSLLCIDLNSFIKSNSNNNH